MIQEITGLSCTRWGSQRTCRRAHHTPSTKPWWGDQRTMGQAAGIQYLRYRPPYG
jgi:hypothetical protein